MSSDIALFQIADYFTKLSEAEMDLGITRKVLNDKYDFAPASLHQQIANDREAITTIDLVNFLKSMGENIEYSDCFKLILTLSPISLCRMKLREFLDFVCERDYWENLKYKKFYGEETYATKFLLTKLFKKELGILELTDLYRKLICKNKDISIHSLFYTINSNGRKYINEDHIAAFFRVYSTKQYISNYAIKALIRRLDRDRDGVVSFIDFFDAIKYYEIPPHGKIVHQPIISPPQEIAEKVANEITPIKETAPTQVKEESKNEVARTLVFADEPKKPRDDLFSKETREHFNKLAASYSNFKQQKSSDSKAQTIADLNKAKEAIDNSFERINKSIAESQEAQHKQALTSQAENIQETPKVEANEEPSKTEEEQPPKTEEEEQPPKTEEEEMPPKTEEVEQPPKTEEVEQPPKTEEEEQPKADEDQPQKTEEVDDQPKTEELPQAENLEQLPKEESPNNGEISEPIKEEEPNKEESDENEAPNQERNKEEIKENNEEDDKIEEQTKIEI